MGASSSEGSKLFAKFQELGIETGKLGENEISAWYDTFDPKVRDFLNWFQQNMTTDNCLTFSETLAKKELEDKNLMLYGSELEEALKACDKTHPGILNREANEYECMLYESELEYYREELKHLKLEINEEKEKHQELIRRKADQMKVLHDADFNKDKAISLCLKYAKELDDLNTGIAENIKKLENYDDLSSLFLCSYENDPEHPNKALAFENIQRFIAQKQNGEYTQGPDLDLEDSLISIGSESFGANDKSYDHFFFDFNQSTCQSQRVCDNSARGCPPRELVERLINAFTSNMDVIIKVDILNEKIKFLQQDNLLSNLNQHRYMLPRKDEPDQSAEHWKSCVSLHRQFINLPTKRMSEIEIETINSDINKCAMIESKLDQLLQYELLKLDWLTCEYETLSGFHGFMQFLKAHISNLQATEERIDTMKATIGECSEYCARPLEETFRPLREMVRAIGAPSDLALADALEAVRTFEAKYDALKKMIFVDAVDANAAELRKLENRNKALISRLSTRETGEIVIVPSTVYRALRSANRAMEDWAKEMKYYQGMPKMYAKKLDQDERRRIKRQLWMYFLVKPEKIRQLLEESRREKRSECATFFQSQS